MGPGIITIREDRYKQLIDVEKAAQRADLSAAYDFAPGEPLSIVRPLGPVLKLLAV